MFKRLVSAGLLLAMVVSLFGAIVIAVAVGNDLTYEFYADNIVDNVVTVAPGGSVKIQLLVKGDGVSLMVMQDAIPYDDSLFTATTDAYAESQVQLDLGGECINVMRNEGTAIPDGMIATEFTLTANPGITSGQTVLRNEKAKAYAVDSRSLSITDDDTLIVRIGDTEVDPPPIVPVDPTHTHAYSTEWSQDPNSHWHACANTDGKCDALKKDVSSHISDGGKITVQPTTTTTGTKVYSCAVCGYVMKTESVPTITVVPVDPVVHTHSYSVGWSYDSSRHWHVCTNTVGICYAPRSSEASHISDGGKITRQPTIASAGVRIYSCIVCGYTMSTESIPAIQWPSMDYWPDPMPVPSSIPYPTPAPTLSIDKPHFEDVSRDDWFYDEVMDVVGKGIMKGTSDTKFSPMIGSDRSMLATIMYRLEGSPTQPYYSIFVDVSDDDWFAKEVTWCDENGIMIGYGGTDLFGPRDVITREQLALVLYRNTAHTNNAYLSSGVMDRFVDVDEISDWAVDGMKWAVAQGLFVGTVEGCLNPQEPISRAEMAAVLSRYLDKF